MATDRIDALLRSGEIELTTDGQLRFSGQARDLFAWLDARFEELALEAGAHAVTPSAVIERATLERGGYLEAFGDVAVQVESNSEAFHAPAACYHVYAGLAGQCLPGPYVATLVTACARHEVRSMEDVGRLSRFRMREVVLVGDPEWVTAQRDAWMSRVDAFADAIGLAATLDTATDTFFSNAGRGRRLIQQLKNLKYELRADAGIAGRIAAASFNLHESFFAKRFGLTRPDGQPVASGCVAFGIERWALVCLAQLGSEQIAELVGGGVPRSTMNI